MDLSRRWNEIERQVGVELAQWIAIRSDRGNEEAIQNRVAEKFRALGALHTDIYCRDFLPGADGDRDIDPQATEDASPARSIYFCADASRQVDLLCLLNVDTSSPPAEALAPDGRVRVSTEAGIVHGWGGLKSNALAMSVGIAEFAKDLGRFPEWLAVASVVEEERSGLGTACVLQAISPPRAAVVASPIGAATCGGHAGIVRLFCSGSDGAVDSDTADLLRQVVYDVIGDWEQRYIACFGIGIEAAGVKIVDMPDRGSTRIRVGLPYDLEPEMAIRELLSAFASTPRFERLRFRLDVMRGIGFPIDPRKGPSALDFGKGWKAVVGHEIETTPFLGTSEARHFHRRAIPVTSFGNRVHQLHTTAEYVAVRDVVDAARTLHHKLHEIHAALPR